MQGVECLMPKKKLPMPSRLGHVEMTKKQEMWRLTRFNRLGLPVSGPQGAIGDFRYY